MLIRQKGAGKSFEIYNLSRTNFVLFFDMSTLKNRNSRMSGGKDACIISYYNAIKKVFEETDDADYRYDTTCDLTTKLIFAGMLQLYIWKICKTGSIGYRNWFEYSLSSRETLRKIFEDLQDYEPGSIQKVVMNLEELSDRNRYVICVDEAGELTTEKPTGGVMFRKKKTEGEEENRDPKYTLFHPFVDSLILLSGMGMHRLLSGTTLSLSQGKVLRSNEMRFQSFFWSR